MRLGLTATFAGALLSSAVAANAQTTLRIGLADTPDVIDPSLSRTYSPRIVLNLLCEKLFDLTPDLQIVPQLATSYEWSEDGLELSIAIRPDLTFHDGLPIDADAVKLSLLRHIEMPGSFRATDLTDIDRIEVVDPLTVKLFLKQPSAPLLSALADRGGMIISPEAAALGDQFSTAPACSGPFKFVESVAQDRIVLEKFEDYYDPDYHFDRVVFMPIPDGTVRAANLRSGQLDMSERVSPADLAMLSQDPDIEYTSAPALGFDMLTFNVDNGPRSETPMGKDPRVRAAFEAAIDRNILNQVIFDGAYIEGNQFVSPQNFFYNPDIPVPPRDVERARQLMEEAGVTSHSFTLITANQPDWIQAAQIIQSMVAEVGFEMDIEVQENAVRSQRMREGDFDVGLSFFGGRVDPDGNLRRLTCEDSSNDAQYCNEALDRLSDEASVTQDPETRKELYNQAMALIAEDNPIIYLWHRAVLTAFTGRVEGFVANPDGLIRLKGVRYAD